MANSFSRSRLLQLVDAAAAARPGWQERGAGQRDGLCAVLQRGPEADRTQIVEVFAQGDRPAVKAIEWKRGERVRGIRLGQQGLQAFVVQL